MTELKELWAMYLKLRKGIWINMDVQTCTKAVCVWSAVAAGILTTIQPWITALAGLAALVWTVIQIRDRIKYGPKQTKGTSKD